MFLNGLVWEIQGSKGVFDKKKIPYEFSMTLVPLRESHILNTSLFG